MVIRRGRKGKRDRTEPRERKEKKTRGLGEGREREWGTGRGEVILTLTVTGVDWVALIVLGPLNAVLHVIQVPTGGVDDVIAQRDGPAHVSHVPHPHLYQSVVGQLQAYRSKVGL